MKKGIYINDAIHGLISLTEYERRIVSTIGFNRLHDVYQNSTVYLTFPSNRTKRFEHSIGTMKLSSDMFFQSLLNAKETKKPARNHRGEAWRKSARETSEYYTGSIATFVDS